MVPIKLNRRRFLGCSAAAGLALAQGVPAEGCDSTGKIRLGVIGLGNRGTNLLRAALELPAVEVIAVADLEPRHRSRAQGIVEKQAKTRPDASDRIGAVLERDDVDAVIVALPCDLHAESYVEALRAGKHLYAEKPLAPGLSECDAVLAEAEKSPGLVVHVGFQRRSNPRFRDGVELLRRGEIGRLIEARVEWSSSNGPVEGHDGWLGKRARSGDWMVEQAVHVWDLLRWVKGELPIEAHGWGDRAVFASLKPDRDVTDYYRATLRWRDGFSASMVHSWVDPADDAFTGISHRVVGTEGGFDFQSGVATFRDRTLPRRVVHPGPQPDTRLALASFLDEIRSGKETRTSVRLREARDATLMGLLVRKAVDEGRTVTLDEVSSVVLAVDRSVVEI